MLVSAWKSYRKPDREIIENLAKKYAASANEVGLA
jgi:hypothetical protein